MQPCDDNLAPATAVDDFTQLLDEAVQRQGAYPRRRRTPTAPTPVTPVPPTPPMAVPTTPAPTPAPKPTTTPAPATPTPTPICEFHRAISLGVPASPDPLMAAIRLDDPARTDLLRWLVRVVEGMLRDTPTPKVRRDAIAAIVAVLARAYVGDPAHRVDAAAAAQAVRCSRDAVMNLARKHFAPPTQV